MHSWEDGRSKYTSTHVEHTWRTCSGSEWYWGLAGWHIMTRTGHSVVGIYVVCHPNHWKYKFQMIIFSTLWIISRFSRDPLSIWGERFSTPLSPNAIFLTHVWLQSLCCCWNWWNMSKTLCLWYVKCLRGDSVIFQRKMKTNKGLFFGPAVSILQIWRSHMLICSPSTCGTDGVRLFWGYFAFLITTFKRKHQTQKYHQTKQPQHSSLQKKIWRS